MGAIHVNELKEETKEKLGIKLPPPIGQVGDSLIALGRVFRAVRGLPDEEALRVLQQAQMYILARVFPEIEEEKPGTYVPPMEWVVQVVARSFNLMPSELKQRSRNKEVVQARQVAMYILRMTNNLSLREVGQELGGRSPATVSHGFQKVAERLGGDKYLSRKVLEICTILTEGEND